MKPLVQDFKRFNLLKELDTYLEEKDKEIAENSKRIAELEAKVGEVKSTAKIIYMKKPSERLKNTSIVDILDDLFEKIEELEKEVKLARLNNH